MFKYIVFSMVVFSNIINGQILFTHKVDPFATHQPVLYEMACNTTGPIIEFGCGNSSTDLLHEICKNDKRILISIDDDLSWLNKFAQKYRGDGYEPDNSGWHKFFYVPGRTTENNNDPERWINFLDSFKLLKTMHFDVCFIDQNPWLGRVETIKRMRGKARYIILHDFNYYPMYNVFGKVLKLAINGDPGEFDLSDVFKYYKVYFPNIPWPGEYGPGTLLASDIESTFPNIDYNKY